jgi:hypothetical protein
MPPSFHQTLESHLEFVVEDNLQAGKRTVVASEEVLASAFAGAFAPAFACHPDT